ncbi:MAG: superfamily helicase [Verrucomicrobiaceae bacterium]|nr:superfamily helicase [Verrucomicrobiaceae bacterium]
MTDLFRTELPVLVVDDITARPEQQQAIFDLMTGPYAELAATRQLHLKQSLVLPPFERSGHASQLLFVWEYPSLNALWQARMTEESDTQLAALWAQVNELSLRRTRRLGRPEPMQGCGREPVAPPPVAESVAAVRRILFVAPSTEIDSATQAQWVAAATAFPGAVRSQAGFNEGYSFLLGQMTWDISTPATVSLDDLLAALPTGAQLTDAIELGETLGSGVREPQIAGIKRTILLQATPSLGADQLAALEQTTDETPHFITDLRNWRFSRVARSHGTTPWTHCVEQEVFDAAVFMTSYLNHPFHWAIVDRYFHPEGHERSAVAFCHTLYPIARSTLAEPPRR